MDFMNKSLAIIMEAAFSQDNKYYLIEEFVIAFGYNCAALLGFLINKFCYYLKEDKLFSHPSHGSDWFYLTIGMAEQQLHLSRDEQDGALKKMKEYDLIEIKTIGIPPKRYFRLNLDKIAQFLVSRDIVSNLRKTHKLAKSSCEPKKSEKVENSAPTDVFRPICGKSTNQFAENPQIASYNIYTSNINNNTPPTPVNGEATDVACFCDSSSFEQQKKRAPEKKDTPKKEKIKPPPDTRTSLGSHVKLKPEDYHSLCEKHSRKLIDSLIEEMNDYCAASKPKGYVCYASAIRMWVRRRVEITPVQTVDSMEKARQMSLKVEKILDKSNSNAVLHVLNDCVEFTDKRGGPLCVVIKYSERNFMQLMENHLNKVGFKNVDLRALI